ncbi:MAG: thiamine phosphate synthase [Planctomycetes bacterium]|nr:thiamine phosphate synthase [Planctomycetota bacterium]
MSVLRIIDANSNRAREALRVMEEAARFILDDAPLTAGLKTLRHDLAAAVEPLLDAGADRDVSGDVGTRITTDGERTRRGVASVAVAAGRRLGEALRAIEEYAKTIDANVAASVEALRYRGYDLERRLLEALGAGRRPPWRVCVILGEASCAGRPWREVAEAVARSEPDCIQVREPGLDDRALLDRVREIVALVAGRSAVIVNDRPDIALLAGADGVHLGQTDLPCSDVRRLAAGRLIVGVSTSRIAEARQALADGADYCGVGPMFPSATKDKPVIVGPDYLREYVASGGLPHLAIGGITPENVPELVAAGARGVAVSAAVCAADDPAGVIKRLRHAMGAVVLA